MYPAPERFTLTCPALAPSTSTPLQSCECSPLQSVCTSRYCPCALSWCLSHARASSCALLYGVDDDSLSFLRSPCWGHRPVGLSYLRCLDRFLLPSAFLYLDNNIIL